MTTHHACTRTLRSAKLALRDRYGIKSRKSLYSRLNGLGIKLAKKNNKSYATEEQIALLDQQNEHIKNGGSIDNFEPVKIAEVTVHNTATEQNGNNGISSIVETQLHSTQLQITPELLENVVEAISNAISEAGTAVIASKMTPPDPLWYLGRLEAARCSDWKLTTSQVKELIGVKPKCQKGKKTFKRGSFIFVKCGKIGSETAWKVMKEADDGYKV